MLIIAGCSKDRVKTPPTCLITTIAGPQDQAETFSYDGDGRLIAVKEGSSLTKFSYTGDSIIKESVWKSVFALNGAGRLAFERREYSKTADHWETRTYDYEGTQLKRVTVKSYSGSNVRTYSWLNGNLIKENIQGAGYSQVITYEYYSDKPYQLGDIQSWDLLENGVESIRNKNLTKKYTSIYTDSYGIDKQVLYYRYSFDAQGKIAQMTVTAEDASASDPSVYGYSYICH